MHLPDSRIDFPALAARLPALVKACPKAELHMHIEGSLEPELMFSLAQKHGMVLPYATVEQLRKAYAFGDLQSFLDIYYAGASVLRDEDDFFQMTWAYLKRAAADNVIHTEIFFDPQTHTARGIAMATVFAGLNKAVLKARSELGLSASLILCFLRHLPESDALQTLDEALPFRASCEAFIGVGLDSSEKGHPPENFERVFARARELGLRVVAHAGEEGPPAYIWSALDVLKVERIDHGVRCAEDPALVARLRETRMPLTVCPLSNIKLRVFQNMREHNLGKLLDEGLCITLNSDDPAYFGGYLNENFMQTVAGLGLNARQVWQLAANSFEASFVAEASKAAMRTRLDQVFLDFCK